ncbi:hypothetical protein CBR_g30331 [Chara braunii]|uniref:aspartyl aminopeptidase n=1 Tax=Chara braunii TaxID=69332 RepID=A0A388JX78_CHABU|nr:hypothetical protein CBR_g30331 [Chara braunii]|eukprot:GBG62377.1 hypothetical protein CBR_g30331 [Chara braunii]
MRIPTLAIHFDRTVVQDGFKYNTESHLAPVLATAIKSELKLSSEKEEKNKSGISAKEYHHSLLLEILADELKCDIDEIVDLEMSVCDTQPSAIGGARDEFIFSGRLDNLASSFCALRALIDSCSEENSLEDEKSVRMVALFDNEEVGSNSAQGAGSPTLFHAMKRIARLLARSGGNAEAEGIVERAIQRSFLVSADMGHALHPNYPDKHAENHQPKLNEGLIIKHNVNQRYATTVVTSFLFREIARLNNIPFQYFAVRNDMGCGSTIGPILSSGIGIRTVDVGLPQLSMHSVREMMGTADVDISYDHFKAFFKTFNSIDEKLKVDG